jgi:hypothetical protein
MLRAKRQRVVNQPIEPERTVAGDEYGSRSVQPQSQCHKTSDPDGGYDGVAQC